MVALLWSVSRTLAAALQASSRAAVSAIINDVAVQSGSTVLGCCEKYIEDHLSLGVGMVHQRVRVEGALPQGHDNIVVLRLSELARRTCLRSQPPCGRLLPLRSTGSGNA